VSRKYLLGSSHDIVPFIFFIYVGCLDDRAVSAGGGAEIKGEDFEVFDGSFLRDAGNGRYLALLERLGCGLTEFLTSLIWCMMAGCVKTISSVLNTCVGCERLS
jgi:hypothetical protein